jgi:glycine cleavage system P protein (glycine dehydrogenase) subunit 1
VRYIPHTDADVQHMLARTGYASLEALLAPIPDALRLARSLAVPEGRSEQEVFEQLAALAARNEHAQAGPWFLGAGTYAHYLPSAVDALVSRAEFTTSYTPYQPEISQGTLQAIFEWQTLLCALTGLEVTNASMYDGASATAEAVLMALRLTRRRKVAIAGGLHPHYRQVLTTYLEGLDVELVTVPVASDGRCPLPATALDEQTACFVVQQPSFFGCVEELRAAAETVHARGALLVVAVAEALSLALLEAPGTLGADLVCGEAQSFGVPMSFGGPHLGFLAARQAQVRQLPGRLVGQTVDAEGRRGFVLTLSTREQHIRRERATSNICTNQGLCLLMATIYLALLGRRGLRELAELNLAKAEYAKARVRATAGLSLPYAAPSFNEFVIGLSAPAATALDRARRAGVVAGLDLAPYVPGLGPALLFCATELASRESIDRAIGLLAGAPS